MGAETFPQMMKLGFGLMRLPKRADDSIDMARLERMVDSFLAAGGTYFDTAYPYHGGASERAVKEVLVKRHPRESFRLADKLPAWSLQNSGDIERIFSEQLERTGAGYFDFYLLHSVEKKWYPVYSELGCWEWAQQMKHDGLIKHVGFSFHDDANTLEAILSEHPEVEFVQLQLNYLDWENPIVQARKNWEVCRAHGVPVSVMEPVKGGTLASLPADQHARLVAAQPGKTDASWALRYALGLEGVFMVLSGMSDESQMEDNLATMLSGQPLGDDERRLLFEVAEAMTESPAIGCTACRYCVDGCPREIVIPELFGAYNARVMFGDQFRSRSYYKSAVSGGRGCAFDCIGCGACETSCPQHLPIRELLEMVSAQFDSE